MRIGAIGHQRIGGLQHSGGDIGVQVQAGDNGDARAHDSAQRRQQPAFTVIVVAAHHGPMQVQIDGVEVPVVGGGDDQAGDALKRVLFDMRRRRGPGPQDRDQVMTAHGADEAADGNVDIAHRQHVGAMRHGRESAAPHEVVIACGGGRESVGFVLKARNQDAHAAKLACWPCQASLARPVIGPATGGPVAGRPNQFQSRSTL